mmetsp:Transcript_57618/g.128569  ORF Transcript_57618/g.128569 Transcript_57618/m.128569 type:complete len:214 (-) Transcript_57618:91-732(-)
MSSSSLFSNGKQPQSITCKHIPNDQMSTFAPYMADLASSSEGGVSSCQYQITSSGAEYSGVPWSPLRVPASKSSRSTNVAHRMSQKHTTRLPSTGSFCTCTVSGLMARSTTPRSCARFVASTSLVKSWRAFFSARRPRRSIIDNRSSPPLGTTSFMSIRLLGDCTTSWSETSRAMRRSSASGESASTRCAAMDAHISARFRFESSARLYVRIA